MMKYFFDTEFIEDGKTIELVSIGIVSEDSREYYAEVQDVSFAHMDGWFEKNVLPNLGNVLFKMKRQIAKEIVKFVGDEPEFWAYYADYDWVVLCQLYGRMIELPRSWPMFCMDVKQLAVMQGNPRLPEQTTTEHHALNDAWWTKCAYDWLTNKYSNEQIVREQRYHVSD